MGRKRELSTNPKQVRVRMKRKFANLEEEIERLKPLEEWDWQELQRGYPRGPSGQFGKKPTWADAFKTNAEVQRRLKIQTQAELGSLAGDALRVMKDLMTNEEVDLDGKAFVPASVRQKAAEFILDHTIGKPTNKVEIGASDGLKEFLADIMVDEEGNDSHPVIIPGEIEGDDEDPEE